MENMDCFLLYKTVQKLLLTISVVMELRSSLCAALLLFLLSASSQPCLSTGRLRGEAGSAEEEVYEIDYRGPETHSSSFPPPNRLHHGGSFLIHHTGAGEPAREHKKTLRTKHNARKIHG